MLECTTYPERGTFLHTGHQDRIEPGTRTGFACGHEWNLLGPLVSAQRRFAEQLTEALISLITSVTQSGTNACGFMVVLNLHRLTVFILTIR